MLGLNIVEFAGDDEALIDSQVSALCERLDGLIARQEAGVIGWQLCTELAGVERIYAMRKSRRSAGECERGREADSVC